MNRLVSWTWHRSLVFGWMLTVMATLGAAAAQADDRNEKVVATPVDFRRDIVPILSDRCFQCHGPDAKAREADLRLDRAADLLRQADPLVVPGRASASELVRRLTSNDDDVRMPPPESNLTLRPAEIDLIRRWIDEGAHWQDHWAFVPPRRVDLPEAGAAGVTHPIDRFVRADLARQGIAPSPEADRATLIRRVVLDLTGLAAIDGRGRRLPD